MTRCDRPWLLSLTLKWYCHSCTRCGLWYKSRRACVGSKLSISTDIWRKKPPSSSRLLSSSSELVRSILFILFFKNCLLFFLFSLLYYLKMSLLTSTFEPLKFWSVVILLWGNKQLTWRILFLTDYYLLDIRLCYVLTMDLLFIK